MLSIKIATTADIPLIRDLSFRIWPQTYHPIIGEKQVEYMLKLFYAPEVLEQQMTENQTFAICYNDGTPIAFAAYSEIESNIYKLHKLYALPQQQRIGIGKYLLNYVTDDLKKRGAIALRLNVNRHNYPAKAFYAKSGFKHFTEEDIDIGGGYFMNDHVLELAI